MDAYEAILSRRSIRKYRNEPIGEESLRKVLEAAMQAPSAVDKQPWHFVVLTDRNILDAIPDINPNAAMIREAPAAVLVCGDPAIAHSEGYLPLDCSAATQNILLAAHALGIGSVWCGIYPREDRMKGLRDLLGIPESIAPFALIVLGYPAQVRERPDRYREDRIHRDRW